MVKIQHWVQDTQEYGHLEETAPMTLEQAYRMIDSGWFYNAEIIPIENHDNFKFGLRLE